jgi:hypothetical protein
MAKFCFVNVQVLRSLLSNTTTFLRLNNRTIKAMLQQGTGNRDETPLKVFQKIKDPKTFITLWYSYVYTMIMGYFFSWNTLN